MVEIVRNFVEVKRENPKKVSINLSSTDSRHRKKNGGYFKALMAAVEAGVGLDEERGKSFPCESATVVTNERFDALATNVGGIEEIHVILPKGDSALTEQIKSDMSIVLSDSARKKWAYNHGSGHVKLTRK